MPDSKRRSRDYRDDRDTKYRDEREYRDRRNSRDDRKRAESKGKKRASVSLSFENSDESTSDGDAAVTKLKKLGDVTKSRFQTEKQAAKRLRISVNVETSSTSNFSPSTKQSSASLPLSVSIGYAKDIGKRKTQEDMFCSTSCNSDIISMCVLDGHGGARASTFLSKDNRILTHIHDALEKDRWRKVITHPSTRHSLSDTFRSCFKELDGDLLDLLHVNSRDDGSTAVVGTLLQGESIEHQILVTSHVGDSRAIVIKQAGKNPVRLTTDHKVDDIVEKKRIEEAHGNIVCSDGITRVKVENRGLAVARAFGDPKFKEGHHLKKGPVVTATPDVNFYKIAPDVDYGVILASDGLWERVSDDAVSACAVGMIQAASLKAGEGENTMTQKTAEKIANALVDKAKRSGSADNTTVGVMLFSKK